MLLLHTQLPGSCCSCPATHQPFTAPVLTPSLCRLLLTLSPVVTFSHFLRHELWISTTPGWEKPWVEQIVDRIMKGSLKTTEERTQGVVSSSSVVGRGGLVAGAQHTHTH